MSIYNPGPIDPATNLPTIPGGPASPAYPGIPPTASMRLPSDNLPSIPGTRSPSPQCANSYLSGEPKKDAGSPGTRGMPEPAPKYTDIMNSPKVNINLFQFETLYKSCVKFTLIINN